MDGHGNKNRGVRRYPVSARRVCALGILTFRQLEWTALDVQIVDISVVGIGIESNQQIEPGIVWFKERVGGFKSGVLIWSRQDGPPFRAGIKFVSLSRDKEVYLETYLQEQTKQSPLHKPLQNPDHIISTIIDSFKKEQQGLL
jgi:hypothetical protein